MSVGVKIKDTVLAFRRGRTICEQIRAIRYWNFSHRLMLIGTEVCWEVCGKASYMRKNWVKIYMISRCSPAGHRIRESQGRRQRGKNSGQQSH